MKSFGIHLVPTPAQVSSGVPAWTRLFVEWPWSTWIKPQVDKSVALGAQCIGLIGCMDGVHSSAITQAIVNSRWQQLAGYCSGLGVEVYPKTVAFNQMVGVSNSECADYVTSILGSLAGYNNVRCCDILMEVDAWNDGSGTMTTIISGRMNSIYSLVKDKTSLPCTYSVASEWKGQALRSWMAQWANSVDYLDFHAYAMNGWNPTIAEAGYWFSTYPGKNIWFGEGGSPQSDSVATQNAFLNMIGSLVDSDSRFLGWLQWSAQDQDTVATDQWGVFDAVWNMRTNKASVLTKLSGGNTAYPITDAQLSTLQSTWKGVTVPTVTQAQIDSVQSVLNAITGTPTPAPTPPSAPEVQVPRDGPSLTYTDGSVWTLGIAALPPYGNQINRNNAQAGGGWGVLLSLKAGQLKHVNGLGQWYLWNGSGWIPSSAP